MKFYACSHCGNVIVFVKNSEAPVVCCGEKMQELEPNTTDAAVEKRVLVVQVDGQKITVTVGSTEHLMLPEHYIEWITLAAKQGNQGKELEPGQKPQVEFMVCPNDEVGVVCTYRNFHGLWKAQDFFSGDTGKHLD